MKIHNILLLLGVIGALAFPAGVRANEVQTPAAQYTCPTSSGNNYSQGGMNQWDFDNPVRPAWNHADKNLALRSYDLVNQTKAFVQYGSDDPQQPPQFATLFNPDRTPTFSNTYQAHSWNWQNPPNPGTQGPLISNSPWPVTVLGLQTTPGEVLQAPTHARNLGAPFGTGGSVVIFADADSITLHFTREDSAAAGYTMHIDNICVDPNLLSLYNSLDNNTRNTFHPPARDGDLEYNLAGLTQGQTFGTARGTEIRVAIVDTGAFMDPRSRDEWWQIRPSGPPPPPPTTFSDVPTSHWAHSFIEKFYNAKITTGCAINPLQYCPEREVTRAELAVFLLRALHYPSLPYTPSNQGGTFSDVPVATKEWMEDWIEEFYDLGITTGCATGPLRYCPENNVTRAEIAVFILRAKHVGQPGWQPPAISDSFFDDVPVAGKEWMMPWIDEFRNQGYSGGCTATTYCPERPITRAEMATFIVRAFNLP
jgi:hypothetical protein